MWGLCLAAGVSLGTPGTGMWGRARRNATVMGGFYKCPIARKGPWVPVFVQLSLALSLLWFEKYICLDCGDGEVLVWGQGGSGGPSGAALAC